MRSRWLFWLMDFSLFTQRFFVKNVWKFISQMGNLLEVYETKYKVKKVINLVLGKIWPPSDLLFLEWSYCSLVNTRSDANYNTSVQITLIWLLFVADSGTDIRHICIYNTISYRVIIGNWYYLTLPGPTSENNVKGQRRAHMPPPHLSVLGPTCDNFFLFHMKIKDSMIF